MSTFINPTDYNPYVYDSSCVLYANYMIVDNLKLNYRDLTVITQERRVSYTNGVKITDNAVSEYIFYDSEVALLGKDLDEKGFETFGMSYKKGLIPFGNNKNRDRYESVHNFLSSVSFEERLNKHIYFLKRDGYFNIVDTFFHNNGDIFTEGKFIGNIQKANLDNKLIFGENYGGRVNRISNPYALGFIHDSKLLGFSEDKTVLNNVINKDIVDLLITNCIKTGKMI